MSFLSRRPSRSGSRDGDAGRDDEYGDYDYAPDGYGGEEDESWSPGEYFSPEGIKGRRAAGQRPADHGDTRGRRADARRDETGRGDQAPGYEDRADDGYNGHAPGNNYGYGADEYATGAYELPEGSDEEPAERGSRRRKDSKDSGERTGIFRLRRDRGEDIWPDDGVSDEDYWASVASDRPLTGPGSPREADPLAAAGSQPMGRPGSDGRPAAAGGDVRAAGPWPGADSRTGADQRFSDERGGTGRLGPPPGLRDDYQPGGAPGAARLGTGPQARPGTGPQARPGSGPMPVRPAASAGAAGAWSSQAGFAQSGAQPSYRPSGPQSSYQPGGPATRQQDSRETDSRQPDRGADWGERTERIERVNASGYPEPRGSSRSQAPGRTGSARASDPFGAPVTSGPPRTSGSFAASATSGPFGAPVAAGRGSADGARRESSWAEADRRAPERRAPARDIDRDSLRNSGGWPVPSRDTDRGNVRDSGGWPAAGRGGTPADRAGDDDPLTSRAFSRTAVSDADGRSYRVAARRSQAQAQLTEEPTATFTAAASYPSDRPRARPYDTGATEVYPAGGQYQSGATGEYPAQYPTGASAPGSASRSSRYPAGEYGQYQDGPQSAAARYPGYGSQPSQPSSHSSLDQAAQSGRRGHSGAADPNGPTGAGRPASSAAAGGPAGSGRSASLSATYSPSGYGRPNGSAGPNGSGTTGRPSGPYQAASQSAQAAGQPVGGSGRVSLPGGSATQSGQYPTQSTLSAQQPRQPQQRPHSQPSRHAAPSQPPAVGSASQPGSGSSAADPARTTSASTGQDPYDSSVTGSYPYPSQPYPSRSAAPATGGSLPGAANPAVDTRDSRDSREGRSYRPVPPSADGYGPANAGYGTPGYGNARDGRR